MARYKYTTVLDEAIQHVRDLGIDEITFGPGVHLNMMDFLELVQTFRLVEGDPARLTLEGDVRQGGDYDFVIIEKQRLVEGQDHETTTRILHVRKPSDTSKLLPSYYGQIVEDMDFFDVLLTGKKMLISAYLETRTMSELAALNSFVKNQPVVTDEILRRKMTEEAKSLPAPQGLTLDGLNKVIDDLKDV